MSGTGLKLTSYFGERHRTGRDLTGNALLDLYARREIAASVLLRGTQGFGLRQHLRTDRSLTLSEDLPALTVAVDTRPRIEAVLEQTLAMAPWAGDPGARLPAGRGQQACPSARRPNKEKPSSRCYLSRHDQA